MATMEKRTFSIALLVRPPFDPFLPFLALRIDALLRYAILDTTKTRASIVAFLTCLLTIGTGILDLPPLRTCRLGLDQPRREWIHVHWHPGVCDRMHGHGRLSVGR